MDIAPFGHTHPLVSLTRNGRFFGEEKADVFDGHDHQYELFRWIIDRSKVLSA